MAANGTTPKITLYTNHRCPWAHRAHITLKEIGLPYEEVIIDLDRPRDPWYLEVNPRGLVPSIKYSNGAIKDEIITESGIVSQFLADAHPSHLLPTSNTPEGALKRARINFFVDTWFSKIGSFQFKILLEQDEAKQEEIVKEFLALVEKEIEPLLKDAAPFFGGSEKLTLAEALTAPFALRNSSLSKHGALPASLGKGLDALPNYSKWAKAVIAQESVTYIYDEEAVVKGTVARVAKLKATGK
ncbi:thioredoxin-like protein [Mytilinidion resinicola]|uniref:Thioredoxin-like protein n=1 Tax=Mytilinidion resinicola TaxID=574789 RepID=A0A6A6YV24_9PEZI|nr:thioredoxin-like protein [Mytilinidion resinicola]KAF2812398.1 thioredoxin-like protein [Mytilinidion resinicola]